MDGQDTVSGVQPVPLEETRKDPCAMFFIIFGLIYEALSTASIASDSSSSNRHPSTAAAFRALQSIVAPRFSGQALIEQTTFRELMGLCYRIAMTESASMQLHLVAALSALAAVNGPNTDAYVPSALHICDIPSRYSLTPFFRLPSASDSLHLPPPSVHCLRICAYLVRRSRNGEYGPALSKQNSTG